MAGGQVTKPSQTTPTSRQDSSAGQSRPSLRPALAPPRPAPGCAGVLLGPFLPTLSLLSARSGTFPRGCFWVPRSGPGSRDRLLSSTGSHSRGDRPVLPWGPARPPVGPPPSHSPSPQCPALCLDQQRVLLKGRADGGRRDAGLVSRAARSGACLHPWGLPWGWVNGGGRGKASQVLPPPPWGW